MIKSMEYIKILDSLADTLGEPRSQQSRWLASARERERRSNLRLSSEIATLPSVARNDNSTSIQMSRDF